MSEDETDSIMATMAKRMGEACRQTIHDECLTLGIRRVPLSEINISGGGLPPSHFPGGEYAISDAEVAEWEARTGRTFSPSTP